MAPFCVLLPYGSHFEYANFEILIHIKQCYYDNIYVLSSAVLMTMSGICGDNGC